MRAGYWSPVRENVSDSSTVTALPQRFVHLVESPSKSLDQSDLGTKEGLRETPTNSASTPPVPVGFATQQSIVRQLPSVRLSFLKTRPARLSCVFHKRSHYWAGHGQMVSDPHWGTALRYSYAARVGAGEPRPSTTNRRLEGAPAAPTADGSRPDLLGRAVEAVEELAEFSGGGAARDGGAVAPSGLQALLGLEESTPTGSARDWDGTAGSDTADEHRQSSLILHPS